MARTGTRLSRTQKAHDPNGAGMMPVSWACSSATRSGTMASAAMTRAVR